MIRHKSNISWNPTNKKFKVSQIDILLFLIFCKIANLITLLNLKKWKLKIKCKLINERNY